MARRRAEDLIKTNEEYTKLESETPDERPPREMPSQQAAGHRGLERPELATWTDEELRTAVRALGVEAPDLLDREAMVQALLDSDSTAARRS